MTKVSPERFNQARLFVKNNARPLEKAIYEYEFESGTLQKIEKELVKYQNADGGFGNALEPDVRMSDSSVLATTVAFQYIVNYQLTDADMIAKAMNYFYTQFHRDHKTWEIVPRQVGNYPRAPWWNYNGVPSGMWGNPNAEVIGYLFAFHAPFSKEQVDDLVHYSINYLKETCDKTDMHEMYCYLRFAETLPADLKAGIANELNEFVDRCVQKDPANQQGYFAHPLQIVKSPSSEYYPTFSDNMPTYLNRLLEQQGKDGAWSPNWAWGQFEDEWKVAEIELKGIFTLDALLTLKNFDFLTNWVVK